MRRRDAARSAAIDETTVDIAAPVAVAPLSVAVPVPAGPGAVAPDSVAAFPAAEVTDDAASQPTTGAPEADTPPGTPSASPDGQDRQAADETAHRALTWLRPRRPAGPVEPTRVTVTQTGSEPGTDKKPKAKRSRAGFFGVPPASRPDVLTDAETVMFPQLRGDAVREDKGSAKAAATDGGAASEAKAAAPSSIALADTPTQILPAAPLRAGLPVPGPETAETGRSTA